MECKHYWIETNKNPDVSREWVLENGKRVEKYYHKYKCVVCGLEKRMTSNEVRRLNFENRTLNELLNIVVSDDIFWKQKIQEFFELLNGINEDDKVSFFVKLVNEQDKFNDFTKDLIKSYDAFDVYDKYK